MGRLGDLWGRLGPIFGILERSFGVSGLSWTILGVSGEASWAVLELQSEPGEPRPPLVSSRRAPPLQIDRTGLPGEGFGEGEASHTPMTPQEGVGRIRYFS